MWYLKSNPELHKGFPMEGWSEDQIQALELKYNKGNKFPRAFREYLELAGGYGGTGVVYEDWDELREDCEFDMERFGVVLERSFFVFDDRMDSYRIFFLDENREDPTVYILNPVRGEHDREPLLKPSLNGTFSNLINTAIRHIKGNLPPL